MHKLLTVSFVLLTVYKSVGEYFTEALKAVEENIAENASDNFFFIKRYIDLKTNVMQPVLLAEEN